METAVSPLQVFLNHLVCLYDKFQLKTLKWLQKLIMFSFVDEKNMSYSVSHLKTKQEIQSWKELSAPPKKNSVLSVLFSVEKKKLGM